MKTLLLLFLSITAYTQTYYSDSVTLFVEHEGEWAFSRKVKQNSAIHFGKDKNVSFVSGETEVKLRYFDMTDLGDAVRFDFTEAGIWVVLIIQKDFKQYQTYFRNKDCTAIKKVYNITKW